MITEMAKGVKTKEEMEEQEQPCRKSTSELG